MRGEQAHRGELVVGDTPVRLGETYDGECDEGVSSPTMVIASPTAIEAPA
ncbi:hypothetical protein ACFP2T_36125 [Plantactinospora solaniradicis]|uniref:Uncharacterized protein n=1 Tax=Plantactinospora solaniradicis TaxID=1723736 RepID=A0ABW1KIJ6_9ACTN